MKHQSRDALIVQSPFSAQINNPSSHLVTLKHPIRLSATTSLFQSVLAFSRHKGRRRRVLEINSLPSALQSGETKRVFCTEYQHPALSLYKDWTLRWWVVAALLARPPAARHLFFLNQPTLTERRINHADFFHFHMRAHTAAHTCCTLLEPFAAFLTPAASSRGRLRNRLLT